MIFQIIAIEFWDCNLRRNKNFDFFNVLQWHSLKNVEQLKGKNCKEILFNYIKFYYDNILLLEIFDYFCYIIKTKAKWLACFGKITWNIFIN